MENASVPQKSSDVNAHAILGCLSELIADACVAPSPKLQSMILVGLSEDRERFPHGCDIFDAEHFLADPLFSAIPATESLKTLLRRDAKTAHIDIGASSPLRNTCCRFHRDICRTIADTAIRLNRIKCIRQNTLHRMNGEPLVPLMDEYDQMQESIRNSGIDDIWTNPSVATDDTSPYIPNDPEQLTETEMRVFGLLENWSGDKQ